MALSDGVSAKGSSTTSPVVTNAVTTQVTGSTFFVFVAWEGSAFTSITDSKGNTWTQLGTEQAFGPGTARCRMYVCVNGTGGASHTFTLTTAAGPIYGSIFMVEELGVATSSAQDGSTQQALKSPQPFTLGITTTNASDLLVCGIATNSGANPSTLSESSGFTIRQQNTDASVYYSGGIATRIVSGPGTYTPSFTQTGDGGDAGMFLVAFKAAAAGGGGGSQFNRDSRSGAGGMRDLTGGMSASQIIVPAPCVHLPGRYRPRPPDQPERLRAPIHTKRPAFVRGVSL